MRISYIQALNDTEKTTRNLLLGNGFSIACHSKFGYDELLNQASTEISPKLKTIFAILQTTNFEAVIRKLEQVKTSIEIMTEFGYQDSGIAHSISIYQDVIKKCLIESMLDVHPTSSNVGISIDHYEGCMKFLSSFLSKNRQNYRGQVFTINYDLLLYWTCMKDSEKSKIGSDSILNFEDGFGKKSSESDLIWKRGAGQHNINYMHGAVHLYRVENNYLRKIMYDDRLAPIISTIQDNIQRNGKYPVFILEGNDEYKLNAIKQDEYLSFVFDRFKMINGSLFIIGSSFDKSDRHIWDVIASNNNLEKIYIGLYDSTRDDVQKKAIRYLGDIRVKFFNVSEVKMWG